MTDNDNIMIEQLFSEARKMQIEDDGFSRRVMRGLPAATDRMSRQTRLLSRLWTAFCVIVGIALSFIFHVWELAATYIEVFIRTLPTHDTAIIGYAPVMVAAMIASAIGIYRWMDSERIVI